ncbi:unnamed protein product [Cochlearia groenlandica]
MVFDLLSDFTDKLVIDDASAVTRFPRAKLLSDMEIVEYDMNNDLPVAFHGDQKISFFSIRFLLHLLFTPDFIRDVDPDIVIGYNICKFDLPYLITLKEESTDLQNGNAETRRRLSVYCLKAPICIIWRCISPSKASRQTDVYRYHMPTWLE